MSHVSPAKSSLEEAMRGELLPGSILRDSLQCTRFIYQTQQTHNTHIQHTHCHVKFSGLVMNLICYNLLQKGWQAVSQLS